MNPQAATAQRIRIRLQGAVQGVGFRPFVYNLARELGLRGWVLNSARGLVVEVEGPPEGTRLFLERLEKERPPAAVIHSREVEHLPACGAEDFVIRPSDDEAEPTAGVQADLATCEACLNELLDPADRRHLYPFINCTNCGPRYTIILDIPYDRPATTMREFSLCGACLREYTNPTDRRFHAQPNACPQCGPQLTMPVSEAAQELRAGRILALKGVGGFQLLADARSEAAIERLRQRKRRDEKPFALMMADVAMVRRHCELSPDEEALLNSSAAPIVLLKPRDVPGLAPNVAGSSPYLGVMLPYSPLHHLLMRECLFPVVATSGNRSDEPIAIDNEEAKTRLAEIADVFLMHNRPVARPCDDSVVRWSRGGASLVRRARGYAPLPVPVNAALPAVLAVGAHLKNTVAIGVGRQVILSQHVGDLDTLEARSAFERAIEDLCRLYRFRPELVACDLHPDYASTQWARASGLPVVAVQHHHAHLAACAAENSLEGPYLGVAWDGTGYGLDGTVWGGEVFLVENQRFERVAHLKPFRLPGGEAAVREGWRVAAALEWETGLEPRCPPALVQMLERDVNAPRTTSVGRLFDAVAALLGVAEVNHFEGQAAMRLERSIGARPPDDAYPLPEGDWGPLLHAILEDRRRAVPVSTMAARFHNALVGWAAAVALRSGCRQVVLSGGTFQNRYLTEKLSEKLEAEGCRVYTHRAVPPNDGGIALGQAILAAKE